MTLIQRRVGLLFAVLMVLLILATFRAVWLGTVASPPREDQVERTTSRSETEGPPAERKATPSTVSSEK